jgi:hypothetical protein
MFSRANFLLWLMSAFALSSGTKFADNVEIDISWDFEGNDKGGWADATAEEMEMDVRVEGGELRASIRGINPKFDSPPLFLDITSRHYVVMRMMYFGGATHGQLIVKGAPIVIDPLQRDFSKAIWDARVDMVVYSVSGGAESMQYAVDDSPYTTWKSGSRYGSFAVFDVADTRWITSITISSSGDSDSPSRCLFQRSVTSGLGPFVTVSSFTLKETTEPQAIGGFEGRGRYWRLLILDNFGGSSVNIRDVRLNGYDETIGVLPFALNNTGRYVNYYLPISSVILGPMTRMRFAFSQEQKSSDLGQSRPTFRESLAVDYVRVLRAPDVWRVRGCLDKYFDNKNQVGPKYNVTTIVELINGNLPLRYFDQNEMSLPYASTFDCPLEGGVDLRIDGFNFGPQARVFIGGNECPVKSFTRPDPSNLRLETIICRLPPGKPGIQEVKIESGILPGVFGVSPYFSYRTESPAPATPKVINIGATRVDLVWEPPGNEFDHMKTTGYKIIWFQPEYRSRVSNLTVGNVTMTSVRGLEPATQYVFSIAALAEGGGVEKAARLPTDMYGRREVRPNAMISAFSVYTEIIATVPFDFDFGKFDANKTLNHSGVSGANGIGPTGDYGSQGHFGLVLVGSTQVENCNASTTCCDGFNPLIGIASCGNKPSVCANLLERRLAYEYVEGGVTRRQVPSNIPYSDGSPPEKVVLTLDELIAGRGAGMPSIACGPALRLTPSFARESGAAWYPRKQNVREGFDVTITFRISQPSFRCNILDDVNTFCKSRGADGFAFVIQNESPVALGLAGRGLGYEGIYNAFAVELDTYSNYDEYDYYENHVAVMTQVSSSFRLFL